MRRLIGLFAASAILAPGLAQAASLEIDHAAVRVTVIAEARNDIKVEVVKANDKLPLQIVTEGGKTIIKGGLERRIRQCQGRNEPILRIDGVGEVAYADLPQIVVHMPMKVDIRESGAVYGALGRSDAASVSHSSCGGWTIDDVAGALNVTASGVGEMKMGKAGSLMLQISGASHATSGAIRDGVDVHLSGAGGVDIASMAGPLTAQVSGTGGVTIGAGQVKAMRATVSGVGSIDFRGQAESLQASVSGVGSVRARSVTGSISKSVSGIGKITVG